MNVKLQEFLNAIIYVLASVLTGVVIAFGVVEIFRVALSGFSNLIHTEDTHDLFIGGLLKGLECFFLAPMPLLLAFAVRDLITAYKGRTHGAEDEKCIRIEDAHTRLLKLKSVMVGLMATAMAANFLEKSFAEKIDFENITPYSILMLLLVGYAYILDRHGRR